MFGDPTMGSSTDQWTMFWILMLLAGLGGFGAGMGLGPSALGILLAYGGLGLAGISYALLEKLAKR
jgi:hypothetical protein